MPPLSFNIHLEILDLFALFNTHVHYIVCFTNQIKGPSPEMVEYLGMQNLISAIKNSVGLSEGKLLFGFKGIPFIA
jgi:hypothetical protein